jgi:hypothetical protein
MLNVRLDKELEKKLSDYSEMTHQTKSNVVKEALAQYLSSHQQIKSPFELGQDLFGQTGSDDCDLSTSYKSKLKKKIGQKHSH